MVQCSKSKGATKMVQAAEADELQGGVEITVSIQ